MHQKLQIPISTSTTKSRDIQYTNQEVVLKIKPYAVCSMACFAWQLRTHSIIIFLSSLHASSRPLGLMRSSNFLLDVAQPSKICARIYRPAIELVIAHPPLYILCFAYKIPKLLIKDGGQPFPSIQCCTNPTNL